MEARFDPSMEAPICLGWGEPFKFGGLEGNREKTKKATRSTKLQVLGSTDIWSGPSDPRFLFCSEAAGWCCWAPPKAPCGCSSWPLAEWERWGFDHLTLKPWVVGVFFSPVFSTFVPKLFWVVGTPVELV